MGKILFAIFSVVVLYVLYLFFAEMRRSRIEGLLIADVVLALNERKDMIDEFGDFNVVGVRPKDMDFEEGHGFTDLDLAGTKKFGTVTIKLKKDENGEWTCQVKGFDYL